MTIVSALRLNNHEGLMVSDELITDVGYGRQFSLSKKISFIDPVLIGSGGFVSLSREILNEVKGHIRKKDDIGKVVEKLKDTYSKIKRKKMEEGYLRQYGISIKDLLNPQIDQSFRERIQKGVEDKNNFLCSLLVCGYSYEKNDFEIYEICFPGLSYSMETTHSIGSGVDQARLSINKSLEQMTNKERENISLVDGMKILFNSTIDAKINQGVGGSVYLSHIKFDKEIEYNELSELSSKILANSVIFNRNNDLSDKYYNALFENVLLDTDNSSELKKVMFEGLKKKYEDSLEALTLFSKYQIQ